MTRFLLDALIDAIKPVLTLEALLRAYEQRSRHFTLPKRRRRYQLADARFVAGGLS